MATWFFKVFIIFIVCTLSNRLIIANLREYTGHNDHFQMLQGKLNDFGNSIQDLPLHEQRRKRDISGDPKCQGQQSLLKEKAKKDGFHFETTLLDDTLRSISLSWKTNTLLAVTTEEGWFESKPSKVYLSTDGGKTFKLHPDTDINAVHVKRDNGLQKHPRNPAKVYLVANGPQADSSILFSSTDAGATLVKHTLSFNLQSALLFHPQNDEIIMTLSGKTLYVTTDNGNSWSPQKENVIDAKWGPKNNIYCTVSVQQDQFDIMAFFGLRVSTDNDLEVSADAGQSWSNIHKHVYSFGVHGGFLYVSTYLTAEGEKSDNRLMEVSTNRGKTWNAVQLPAIEPDRFFSILDMSYGMVFLHVDEPGNSGFGTLYTSDSTGILFSKSMERHLYPNYNDVTDFYRIQGMRGVYMSSQMEGDNSVHTMITYDRGGEWRHIPRPPGVCVDETKECYLQIHGSFSQLSGVAANIPLSSENAKGLVLAHGHIATSLQTTNPDVYLSSTGGYDWKKVLDGPHHYQIADQGGLIIAVPLVRYPKVIKYSTDEGNCWHEYTFTDKNITLTGLLAEPGNMAMGVAIWAYTDERKWTVHTFNFSKVVDKNCGPGDYVTWQPHGKNKHKGCFLGVAEKFTKIKPDALCHNTGPLNYQNLTTPCPCTDEDYECDYGYYRPESSVDCVLDPMFKGKDLKICLRNHVEEIVSVGYHKIPGDQCALQGSTFHKKEHRLVDMKKTCAEGDMSLIDSEVKDQYLLEEEGKSSTVRANTVVLIVALTILLLVAVIVVAFFAHRNILNRSGGYRYSMLRVHEYDNDVEEALAPHTSLYDDMSDEESRPITKKSAPQLQNGVLPRFDHMSSSSGPQPTRTFGTSAGPTSVHIPSTHMPTATSRSANAELRTQDFTREGDLGKVKSYHDDSDVDLLE